MSNAILQTITVLFLLIHVAVLLWATVWRRGSGPAVWLNLAIAAGVWIFWFGRLGEMSVNNLLTAFLVFELVTAVTSIAALRGARVPLFLVWGEFAVHACAAILAVVLAFTFTMRLF